MILEIIKLASELGPSFAVICLIIFIVYRLIKSLSSDKEQLNLPAAQEIELSKDSFSRMSNNLKYHAFFTNVQYRLVAEIPSLELIDNKPVKQQMFRDLLRVETQVIYDICEDVVNIDMGPWSAAKWESEMAKRIGEILTTFVRKAKEETIPDIVINKYNKWHNSNFETMYSYISLLGHADVYKDNMARTNTFLLIMNLLVMTTIADAERSIKELNGEIGGQLYKNMVIEH